MRFRWVNFPIPEAYVIGIIAGWVVDFFFPLKLFEFSRTGISMGIPVVLIGLGLCVWSVIEAGRMEVAAPNALLTGGPYGLSRNPMYVGWALIHLGIAFLANAVWLLGTLALAFGYIHFFEIPKEEHRLEAQFGEEYKRYRQRVRRYL